MRESFYVQPNSIYHNLYPANLVSLRGLKVWFGPDIMKSFQSLILDWIFYGFLDKLNQCILTFYFDPFPFSLSSLDFELFLINPTILLCNNFSSMGFAM